MPPLIRTAVAVAQLRLALTALLMAWCAPLLCAEPLQSVPELEAPLLDGRLDDGVWAEALQLGELRQVSPQPGAAPSVATQILLLRDARMLYIGLRAHENAGEVRIARQTARDADLYGDDHFSVVIDPSGAGRNGYLFRVNANGAQQDALIYDGGQEREDWDAIWTAQVSRDAEGWSAELAIPLAMLSGADGGDWGFNVERFSAHRGERLRWHGIRPERYIGFLREAGRLGVAVSSGAAQELRFKPSLRLTRQQSGGADSDVDLQPGLDLFWRLRASTMATLTLNADFANTEVDDRQVNLTRFPLFLPEKREFFLQDAGIFSFGGLRENVLPFFSRRVGLTPDGLPLTLDGGFKLTHQSREVEAGLLAVRVGDSPETRNADIAVGRVALRAGEHGRIGLIGTSGNPEGSGGSELWGVDWHYRNPQFIAGKALGVDLWSQTSRNAGIGGGSAQGVQLDWSNLGITGSLALSRIDADYAPALGFVQQSGVRQASGEIGYWWRTAAGGDVIPQLDFERTRGIGDPRLYTMINPEIYLGTAGDDYVMPEIYVQRERLIADFEIVPGLVIPAGEYHDEYAAIFAGIGTRSLVSGEAGVRFGQFYGGQRQDYTLETSLRPSGSWGLSLRGEHTRLQLPAGDARVNLAAFGAELTPDPRVALSGIVQWDDLSREIGANLRLRWTLAPGRDVFISLNRRFQDQRSLNTLAAEENLKLSWNWQW